MKKLNKSKLNVATSPLTQSSGTTCSVTGNVSVDVSGTPRRIQLSRKGGWRKPPKTVVVARPTKWGNPYKATATYPVEQAVADYERWLLTDPKGKAVLRAAKIELRGLNLACWCRPGNICHADVLLGLVNGTRFDT